MSCKHGFFKGDDLVDVITVDRPKNSDNIEITEAEVQVGNLPTFVKENPIFPYTISIMREQSVRLDFSNPVHLRITYNDTDGHENIRTTCLGSLTLNTNDAVIKGNQND